MKDKNQFMKEAIRLASENLGDPQGGPFGAVIVKNGEIVGRGKNTVIQGNDPTAHAEINAIREACKNLNSFQLEDCEIYTSCEPCPMCLGAIYWARPSKIYFAADRHDAEIAGFDDSHIYKEIQEPFNNRQIPQEQMMKKEGEELFHQWNRFDKKVAY